MFVCLLSVNKRWSLNDHQMITSWSPLFVCLFVCCRIKDDHQMISRWSPDDKLCLFVCCLIIDDHTIINRWLFDDHQMIFKLLSDVHQLISFVCVFIHQLCLFVYSWTDYHESIIRCLFVSLLSNNRWTYYDNQSIPRW